MSLLRELAKSACVLALALVVRPASGQLYTQSFDTNNQGGLWSINNGPTDENVDLFFNYASVGIPSAPNSTGGSTRGMKLQANLSSTLSGGVNVSPIGQSFTGDYALRFDVWSNFIGAASQANGGTDPPEIDGLWIGGVSSTKVSTFGILSSGVGNNYLTATNVGVAEALYFGATGDGQSGIDYRVHGPGTRGSSGFRGTTETAYNAALDAGVSFADTYPEGHPDAGTTNRGVEFDPLVPFDPNNTAVTDGFLYQSTFPSVSAPGQAAITSPDFNVTQFDSTMPGSFGMAWREVEIKKVGDIVTWSVLNGGANADQTVVLATVNLSQLQTPATSGTNIMFGESDPSNNVGDDPNFAALQFTLIDNVRVEAVAPAEDADFDGDGDIDGADFLTWQRNQGAGDQTLGDANGNGQINNADLDIWKAQFGTATVAAASIPEPGALSLMAVAVLGSLLVCRR